MRFEVKLRGAKFFVIDTKSGLIAAGPYTRWPDAQAEAYRLERRYGVLPIAAEGAATTAGRDASAKAVINARQFITPWSAGQPSPVLERETARKLGYLVGHGS
jgi:hypothetical protein